MSSGDEEVEVILYIEDDDLDDYDNNSENEENKNLEEEITLVENDDNNEENVNNSDEDLNNTEDDGNNDNEYNEEANNEENVIFEDNETNSEHSSNQENAINDKHNNTEIEYNDGNSKSEEDTNNEEDYANHYKQAEYDEEANNGGNAKFEKDDKLSSNDHDSVNGKHTNTETENNDGVSNCNDDDNKSIDNIDEYTLKCGEIYINEKTKEFKLICYCCRSAFNNFGLLSEHITEIHFPFNFKRRKNYSFVHDILLIGLKICGVIFISDICRFIHICVICKKPFEECKKLYQHYLNDHNTVPNENDVSWFEYNNGKILEHKLMTPDCISTNTQKENNDIDQSIISECKLGKTEILTENEGKRFPPSSIWPCKMCPKSFKTNSKLIAHIRVHTGEKPFKCDKCNRKYSKRGNLSSHLLTHSTRKIPRRKCEFCMEIFTTKYRLKKHMSSLHPYPHEVKKI